MDIKQCVSLPRPCFPGKISLRWSGVLAIKFGTLDLRFPHERWLADGGEIEQLLESLFILNTKQLRIGRVLGDMTMFYHKQ